MNVTMSNLIGFQAAWNLDASNARLSESILRLTSGLRIQKPEQGTYEYLRGNQLQADVKNYQSIQSNLSEYKSVFSIGSKAAAEINTTLDTMVQISTQATGAISNAEKTALTTQYNSLRANIDDIVKNTNYEGQEVLTQGGKYNLPLTINLRPDRSVNMSVDLNYLDLLDQAGASPDGKNNIVIKSNYDFTVAGDAAAAATQAADAKGIVSQFISQVSGVVNSLQSQMNINDSVMENYNAAKSSLIDVDVAQETANFAAEDVRNQAAIAMLTQANISHRSLLQLYTFQYS